MSRVNCGVFQSSPPKVADLVEGKRRWRCPLPCNPRQKGSMPSPHILHGLSRSTGAYPANESSRKPISPGLTSDIVKTSHTWRRPEPVGACVPCKAQTAIKSRQERHGGTRDVDRKTAHHGQRFFFSFTLLLLNRIIFSK